MVELDLAIIHACFAQAFFCLAALTAMVTSRWWIESQGWEWRSRVAVLGMVVVGMIYGQLILGALMRHNNAGLAIPDFPKSYGQALPPTNATELKAVNDWRAWSSESALNERVTMSQVWLHFSHRVGAVLVSGIVIWFVIAASRVESDLVRRPAAILLMLLILQFALGVMTVLMRKPADLATAHVAVGALVLVSAFTATIRSMRLGTATAKATVDQEIPNAQPAMMH
jgi:cytochrome c oxidase assembly protein subunit 15